MDILKNRNGDKLDIALTGRLDTNTSPSFETELKAELDTVTELVFDFAKLEYISSAGLRVLLSAQKTINKKGGSMKLKNISEEILEIFEITGFVDILTIEK